jgi:hypothetical protein
MSKKIKLVVENAPILRIVLEFNLDSVKIEIQEKETPASMVKHLFSKQYDNITLETDIEELITETLDIYFKKDEIEKHFTNKYDGMTKIDLSSYIEVQNSNIEDSN